MKIKKITHFPVPVYAVECPAISSRRAIAFELEYYCLENVSETMGSLMRGVDMERLPAIIRNGCDVYPTDAPLFAAHMEKAMEYGANGNQVIQFFRAQKLMRTWVEKPSNIDEQEREELRKTYPVMRTSLDGKRLWFSRLAEDDKRMAKEYERCYGKWLPGNPFEALTCIVVLGENLQEVSRYCVAVLREARAKQS